MYKWTIFYVLAGPVDYVICDHMRAPELYTASVLSSPVCPMRAFPCKSMYDFERGYCFKCASESCPSMGFYADETRGLATGKHFLYTSGSMPFCGEYCMTDWLIDFMIEWLTDWLINWMIDWLVEWLIDWLVDSVSDWLIDWLTDWLILTVNHYHVSFKTGHGWFTGISSSIHITLYGSSGANSGVIRFKA